METRRFDLVVIGTGTAARGVAHGCRDAGWSVAVVDDRPFGGTCPLRGCIPKKVLTDAAAVVDWSRRMSERGVGGGGSLIDWQALASFRRTFTDPFPEKTEREFAAVGIDALHGRARFLGPLSVAVEGAEDAVLGARHVVIASGARPAELDFPGSELVMTSDEFLEREALPEAIVFLGGGYISFEFAHVAARAGARVMILHGGRQPLERFDPDLVDMLAHRTRSLGIELALTTEAVAVARDDGRLLVRARAGAEERTFAGDWVVHGAGRVPALDGLELEAAGVEYDETGVTVNGFMQSVSNPAVYAAGDAASPGPPLTPVASHQADVVVANLLHGDHRKAETSVVPSVVFTAPPLAAVGLSEAAALAQGRAFESRHEKTGDWFSARHVGETCAGHKVLVETRTDLILGAHLLGPEAGEVVNLFALAMRAGMTAQELKDVVFAFPTRGSDVPSMLA